jgi:hypothetical protein
MDQVDRPGQEKWIEVVVLISDTSFASPMHCLAHSGFSCQASSSCSFLTFSTSLANSFSRNFLSNSASDFFDGFHTSGRNASTASQHLERGCHLPQASYQVLPRLPLVSVAALDLL